MPVSLTPAERDLLLAALTLWQQVDEDLGGDTPSDLVDIACASGCDLPEPDDVYSLMEKLRAAT